jgi:hypothetical protein
MNGVNQLSVFTGRLYPFEVVTMNGYTKGFKGKGQIHGAIQSANSQSDVGDASAQRCDGGFVSGNQDGAAALFCDGDSKAQGTRINVFALAVKWAKWKFDHFYRRTFAARAQELACGHAKAVRQLGGSARCVERTCTGGVLRNGGRSHDFPAQTDAACCLS